MPQRFTSTRLLMEVKIYEYKTGTNPGFVNILCKYIALQYVLLPLIQSSYDPLSKARMELDFYFY